MQKFTQAILIIVLLMMAAGCGQQKGTVAKVGREVITEDDFKTAFIQRFRSEDNAKQRSFNDRKKFVEELALSAAKYQEGLARGYGDDPEIMEQLENVAKRRALDNLYTAKVTDKVVTEENTRYYYEQSAKEMRARHILLKAGPTDTTDADDAKLKARIDSIKLLIDDGLSLSEAAVKFSEDATTAPDSGDLEWFPWGRMVKEFQEAAWKGKVGEVVGPVKTPYGYHLILVTEIRTVQGRKPYDEMKEEVKQRLRTAEGQKMADTAREFVESLRAAKHLEYKEEVMNQFREKLQDPNAPKQQELGPVFTGEEKEKNAATYDGGQVTVQDLIEKIGANAARVKWDDPQVMLDLIHAIVEPMFLEEVAEREGFVKKALADPEVQDQKRMAVIARLEKIEITDKAGATEEQEQAYYETHLDQYIRPEHREIREIFIKEDSAKAARVRDRALKGEDFTRLAWRFNEKESTKSDSGRIGPFEQRRFGLIGKTAFRLEKEGDISDVVKVGKNLSVIKLLRIVPSRTKTWLEAKSKAKRDFRVAQTEAAEEDLKKALFEKFPFEVLEDKLAEVWPLEQKEEEKLARDP